MDAAEDGRRRRDLAELCIGYGLILLVLWTARPWQRPLFWVAAAFLVAVSLRPGADRRRLGFSGKNLGMGGLICLAALALSAVAVWTAYRHGTLHVPPSVGQFVARYWGYTLWAFAQQFLLQDFFLLRLERLLPRREALAVAAAAGLFALAHVPSPLLTAFTLVWGLVSCALFVRYRELLPLAIAHAVLGISVAVTLPGHMTHNMRVGLGYLRFHQGTHGAHRMRGRPEGVQEGVGDGGGAYAPVLRTERRSPMRGLSPSKEPRSHACVQPWTECKGRPLWT